MSELFQVAETTSTATPGSKTGWHVWIDSITVYHISHARESGSALVDLRIYKSVDAGMTWDEGVQVPGGASPIARQVAAVWFDQWTPGDTGNLIHIAFLELNTGVQVNPRYTNFDVTTEVFSSVVDVDATSSTFTNLADQGISITKARSGDLYVLGWRTATATENFTFRSTTGGASWSSIASGVDNDDSDHVRLIPATTNEANEDILAIYWDRTAGDLRLKHYDQSGNSWSSVDIAASVNDRAGEYVPISVTVRPSDGEVFVAYWCEDETTSSSDDVCVVQISDATTITTRARLNYVSTHADRAVAIECDAVSGDLYLYQQDFHTTTGVLKSVSTDDGATFTELTRILDVGDVEQFSQCPVITASGGRFQPIVSRLTDSTWQLAEDEAVPLIPIVERLTNTLAYYLPTGRAWGAKNCEGTVVRSLLKGLAQELLRMEDAIQEFRDEILPDETVLFIDEWESALGIPDECFPGTGSIDERRRDVLVKLVALGVQTAGDFQTLANLMGVGLQMSNGADHYLHGKLPFIAFGSDKESRFTIVVDFDLTLPASFTYTFPIVFGEVTLAQIQCLFEKLKPANTSILFTNL